MVNATTDFGEAWVQLPDGQTLGSLVNAEGGCLFYRRAPEDAGFTSRNPKYSGPAEARREYVLADGHRASYPASWALSVADVARALDFFRHAKRPPTFVSWHNDSGDGVVIVPGVRPRMRRGTSPASISGSTRFFAVLWILSCAIAGAYLGGRQGFQILLPPDRPGEEFVCGNPAIAAILFGVPAGVIVGALLGIGFGRLTLKGSLWAIDRRHASLEPTPRAPSDDLWDPQLDA